MTDTHKPSSPRKRKRRSKYNNNTHAFLDVTASIVSSAFAASRLTEIQQLTNRVVLQKDGTTKSSSVSSFATATANIPLDETPYRSGGGKTATRHLRRRATSHQSRKRHRYPQGNVIQSQAQAPKTRKGRRNKQRLLQAPHMQWADELTAISNVIQTPERQQQHWIPTHVWHAKRFHMESLFGWKVPLLHTQRGAKAALRLVREEYCVIQDTTWKTRTIEWTTNNDYDDDDAKDCLSSIIPNFFTKDNTQTIQSGQGMLHMPNQHPMGALGPIEWMVLPIDKNSEMNTLHNPQQQQDDAITATTRRKIRLSVHPALLQTLWDLLTQVLPKKTVHPSCRCSTVATLTLRGKSSHDCLMKTLQKIAALDHDPNIPDNLAHFDTMCLDDLKVMQRNNSPTYKSGSSQSETLIVTRVAPRSPEQSCNWGVCGYNLTGRPQWMARLFHELVITGQACPIGLVEESQLQLECDPPLLHFPRDYVDTPCGQDYWKADDKGSDWFVVRQWQEGGLGRIRPASSLPSISFMGLFSLQAALPMNDSSSSNRDNDKDDQSKAPLSTVVVRGAFGQPILDLLQHATPVPQKTTETLEESDTNKLVKRRRQSRNPTHAVRLPIAPTTWRTQYQAQCATLRASMTLPALLLAHVRVEGSGTVTPGMNLHFYEITSLEPRLLGYVLSGAASHHRGRSHGLAALGASVFLQALESTSAMASNPHQAFVSVPNIQGTRVTNLLVQAGQGKDACTVSLTLIL